MHVKDTDLAESADDNDLRASIHNRLRNLRQQLEDPANEDEHHPRSDRRPFVYVQRIAPYASTLPDRASFREVMCRDISTSGFSFLSKLPPEFKQLVVELGVPPNAMYVIGRVARVERQPDNNYVVGCKFTSRHS